MHPNTIIKALSILIIVLVATTLFATTKAFEYRARPPQVRVEKSQEIIYGHWDPNRSSSYTCITQKVVDNVGMVCTSPEGNNTVSCTVGAGETKPTQYYC